MSKRYVCFQDAVRLILAERDKIPETVPGMGYEFHLPQPNYSGNLIRGGIRKALKVLEMMPKADVVPRRETATCEGHVREGWYAFGIPGLEGSCYYWKCSNCGYEMMLWDNRKYFKPNVCAHCGCVFAEVRIDA